MSQIPAAALQSTGGLLLTIPGRRGLSASALTPRVTIDGAPVDARYGANSWSLPPGRHRLAVHPRPSFTSSHAAAEVEVVAGQDSAVYYTPPISTFGPGSLGPTPRRSSSLVALIAFVIALVISVTLVAVCSWAAGR